MLCCVALGMDTEIHHSNRALLEESRGCRLTSSTQLSQVLVGCHAPCGLDHDGQAEGEERKKVEGRKKMESASLLLSWNGTYPCHTYGSFLSAPFWMDALVCGMRGLTYWLVGGWDSSHINDALGREGKHREGTKVDAGELLGLTIKVQYRLWIASFSCRILYPMRISLAFVYAPYLPLQDRVVDNGYPYPS